MGPDSRDAALATADDDDSFRQEWVRALFADAVAAFASRARLAASTTQFEVFQRYDLDDGV